MDVAADADIDAMIRVLRNLGDRGISRVFKGVGKNGPVDLGPLGEIVELLHPELWSGNTTSRCSALESAIRSAAKIVPRISLYGSAVNTSDAALILYDCFEPNEELMSQAESAIDRGSRYELLIEYLSLAAKLDKGSKSFRRLTATVRTELAKALLALKANKLREREPTSVDTVGDAPMATLRDELPIAAAPIATSALHTTNSSEVVSNVGSRGTITHQSMTLNGIASVAIPPRRPSTRALRRKSLITTTASILLAVLMIAMWAVTRTDRGGLTFKAPQGVASSPLPAIVLSPGSGAPAPDVGTEEQGMQGTQSFTIIIRSLASPDGRLLSTSFVPRDAVAEASEFQGMLWFESNDEINCGDATFGYTISVDNALPAWSGKIGIHSYKDIVLEVAAGIQKISIVGEASAQPACKDLRVILQQAVQ